MLKYESEISGYAIQASDGHIGSVTDLLFEDDTWLVRWLVIDTGNWLPGRKVLLPPSALSHVNHIGHQFSVQLTMHQIKDSPAIYTDRPVSRQIESNLHEYYGWAPYWGEGAYVGGFGFAGVPFLRSMYRAREVAQSDRHQDDKHLRSIEEVIGYQLCASDGEIGHIDDFLISDSDLSVQYVVVDTRTWWPGNKVIISPRSILSIAWAERLVTLNVDRRTVKGSPAYDPSLTIDRAYETLFHTHYGNVRPSIVQPARSAVG